MDSWSITDEAGSTLRVHGEDDAARIHIDRAGERAVSAPIPHDPGVLLAFLQAVAARRGFGVAVTAYNGGSDS